MGIRVEHAASPGVTIGAAFAAGQGQARQKAAIGAAQAASAKGRQESAQKFQAEMLERKHEMGMEDALLQQGLGREDFEWRLTAQQKADQEKYDTALYEIEKTDAFTEDEKEEAKRRIMAKLANIKPLPMRRDRQPSPEEMFGKNTYTDKATGVTYPINPQTGEFGRPIYDPQTAVKSRIDATKAALDYARDSESGAIDKEKFQFAMQQMLGGEGTGGGTPGLPAPAGGAARSLPAPTGLATGAAAGETPQPGLPAPGAAAPPGTPQFAQVGDRGVWAEGTGAGVPSGPPGGVGTTAPAAPAAPPTFGGRPVKMPPTPEARAASLAPAAMQQAVAAAGPQGILSDEYLDQMSVLGEQAMQARRASSSKAEWKALTEKRRSMEKQLVKARNKYKDARLTGTRDEKNKAWAQLREAMREFKGFVDQGAS